MSVFTLDPHEKIKASDLGEQWAPGFYVGEVYTKTPAPTRAELKPEEIETAEPLSKLNPKTHAQREMMPEELAARLIKYYIDNMNNMLIMNPIRDGIPQCREHPFVSGKKYGCWYSCPSDRVLPVAKDQSLGDAWGWVKGLIVHNYKSVKRRAGWSGWSPPLELD